MQTINVSPYDKFDYIHPEETVRIEHLTTRSQYEIFVKDLDTTPSTGGRVGVVIPLDLLNDVNVDGGFLWLSLSHETGGNIAKLVDALSNSQNREPDSKKNT